MLTVFVIVDKSYEETETNNVFEHLSILSDYLLVPICSSRDANGSLKDNVILNKG